MRIKIGFVGSPFSGKTTTAAHVFAELKRLGYPVEFLPEEARNFIRTKRASGNWGEKPALDDDDQIAICHGQYTQEDFIMKFSGSDVCLVTDGSSLNAFFYLNEPRMDPDLFVPDYTLLFFCRNIERTGDQVDGNRVHDADFSMQIDSKMKAFFDRENYYQVREISGDIETRVAQCLKQIAEEIRIQENPL